MSDSAISVSTTMRFCSFCWRACSSSIEASRSALAVAIRAFLSASWIFGWPRAFKYPSSSWISWNTNDLNSKPMPSRSWWASSRTLSWKRFWSR